MRCFSIIAVKLSRIFHLVSLMEIQPELSETLFLG